MECEICGKREAKFFVQVEGAKVLACGGCARHGKILHALGEEEGPAEAGRKADPGVPASLRMEEDVVEGYGKRIRDARQAKKIRYEEIDEYGKNVKKARSMTIEELAKEVGEKASYVDKIEREKMMPTIEVAKKIGRALGITLTEKAEQKIVQAKGGEKKELSLLDMMEMQKKREE